MTDLLETIEIEPAAGPPQLAVIWLHGLGADAHDFEPVVPELKLRVPVRFVFPNAPVRAVTINGGHRMRAWYDIFELAAAAREDEAGIRASAAAVSALIDREVERGVPAECVVLAGFSQGGAIVLQTALREPRRLGGVLALSTYLPLAGSLRAEHTVANAHIPVFMAHGSDDPVIPIARAERSRDDLEAAGYAVDWRVYRMPHSVCMEEIVAIGEWLTERARG